MTLGLNSLRCKEKGGGGLQNGPLHHISPFDDRALKSPIAACT
jgi:hypothetical protein